MTREDALALWGADAVEHALAEPEHEPVTPVLARELRARTSLPPGAFRAWSLTQPWPRFCAIVRIVSGVAHDELLEHSDEESK